MKLAYICISQRGGRETQEDAFLCDGVISSSADEAELSGECRVSSDAPAAFWIFDGLGGLHSEEASRIAAETALRQLPQQRGAMEYLLSVNRSAHKEILDKTQVGHPIGTTSAGLVFTPEGVYAANIGDTRVYCLTACGGLTQVSCDDSALVDSKRYLTQHLGMAEKSFSTMKPHISVCASVTGLQEILLCSDGLYENIAEPELCRIMEGDSMPVAEKGRALMKRALEGSISDNITLILIRLLQEDQMKAGEEQ